MKRGIIFRFFSIFLSLSFILFTSNLPIAFAGPQGKNAPIGNMTSRGEVKFEAREGVWRDVEPVYFPIVPGLKVKTEKGAAVITLTNQSQIELEPKTLVVFESGNRIHLAQGKIGFRFPQTEGPAIRVGSATVMKLPSMQANARPATQVAKGEEAIGSIQVHANGSVTVQTSQGSVTVLSQERQVLAAISAKEKMTIPATLIDQPVKSEKPKMKVAQVGEIDEKEAGAADEIMGLSYGTWGIIGLIIAGAAGIAIAAGGGGGGGDGGGTTCP